MVDVIHGLRSSALPLTNTAVAIGVFDGVHRGHQEILRQTVREARSQGLTPVALTFDIHPSELFAPDTAPSYIASLRQRPALIEMYGGGIAAVVIVQFDRAFAALSPQAFAADVLEGQLGARHVLVGADFCYGKGRAGTVTTLLGAGAANGFAVTVVPPILIDGSRVSSTQIRGAFGGGGRAGGGGAFRASFCGGRAGCAGQTVRPDAGLPHREPVARAAPAAAPGGGRLCGVGTFGGRAAFPCRRFGGHEPHRGHR